MTKKETIRLHRKLWAWLADNPEKTKYDWPGWERRFPPDNWCFLCGYAQQINTETGIRNGCCLLDWETAGHCTDVGSFYDLYDEAETLGERSEMAKKIANLKEAK